jgi:D-inositol-3-phosphate glycosyltransferase
MLPRSLSAQTVCYLANPAPFVPDAGRTARRVAIAWTSRAANAVLVPSAAMAVLAEPYLSRPPEVVPLGIDHARFFPAARPGDDVLCIADFYPHKRHDIVLAAWAALSAPRPRLRLIGDPRVAPNHARAIAAQVAACRGLGTITVESRLDLSALVAAYWRARVLLMPSERESFCMPLLEAQACGVPAVARDSSVLRDTGGDGTTFMGDDDPSRWRDALQTLLEDDVVHATARATGISHAAGYGWDKTAEKIREALVRAL